MYFLHFTWNQNQEAWISEASIHKMKENPGIHLCLVKGKDHCYITNVSQVLRALSRTK